MGRLIRLLKTNFTSGEIDPDLAARTDIKHYYSGAKYMSDVIVKAQGGFRRRPGLEELLDITADATGGVIRFAKFEFSVSVTYELVFVNGKIKVFKNGALVHTITGTPWDNTKIPSINWTQSVDTMLIFHRGTQPYSLLRGTGGDTDWTLSAIPFVAIPYYDYVPVTSTPASTLTPSAVEGTIKLTAGSAVFSSSYVGQKIEGNGGLVKITQFNSTTELVGVTEIPFNNIDAIASGSWTYHSGFEPAWSSTRGWPVAGVFHGGRLILGGGPRPSTIWGSRVGEYYDFEIQTGLAAEPFEVTMDSDGLNDICNIMSLRDLIVFTTGGEFVDQNKPITPNNAAPQQYTRRGSEPGLRVTDLEGSALFVQKGGRAIREFYYTNDYQTYTDDDLTLLAAHLMKSPVGMAKRKASSTESNDLLPVVNADGTAIICSLIRSQQIVAWSRITSGLDCHFIDCGVDNEDVYFATRRTVNGATKYFIERFNEDHYLDCSKRVTTGLPSATLTAAHLPSTEVTVMSDESDMGEYTLNGSGVATLVRNAEDYWEVGINFVPVVETMPIEPELPEGSQLGRKKRIVEAVLILQDTSYVELNNQRVTFKQFGLSGSNSPLDQAPQKFTGRKKIDSLLGYSTEATVRISQTRPGTMEVLGIEIKVSI